MVIYRLSPYLSNIKTQPFLYLIVFCMEYTETNGLTMTMTMKLFLFPLKHLHIHIYMTNNGNMEKSRSHGQEVISDFPNSYINILRQH